MSSDPFRDLGRSLTDICDAYRACRLGASPSIFADGSPAAIESSTEPLAGAWGDTPTADANRSVLLFIEAVVDHLRGMATLFADATTLYAPFTVARSAMEIAAQSWYLLEPEVGAEERALRGINMRLRALWEQAQLPGDDQRDWAKKTREDALKRVDALLSTARSMNIETKAGKRYTPPRVANGLKSTLALVDECVSVVTPGLGSVYWRHGSAITHGQIHGLLSVYEPVLEQSGESVLSGYASTEIRLSARQAVLRSSGALLASRAAVERLCTHMGWEWAELRSKFDIAFAVWGRVGELDKA